MILNRLDEPAPGDPHALLEKIMETVRQLGNCGILVVAHIDGEPKDQLGMAFTYMGVGSRKSDLEEQRLEQRIGREMVHQCRVAAGQEMAD